MYSNDVSNKSTKHICSECRFLDENDNFRCFVPIHLTIKDYFGYLYISLNKDYVVYEHPFPYVWKEKLLSDVKVYCKGAKNDSLPLFDYVRHMAALTGKSHKEILATINLYDMFEPKNTNSLNNCKYFQSEYNDEEKLELQNTTTAECDTKQPKTLLTRLKEFLQL